jgi:hypothetical protein
MSRESSKFATAFLATLAYVALLVVVYVLHVRFFPVDVVFYSALFDAVLAVVLGTVLMLAWPRLRSLGALEKAQLACIWLLLGYAYAISVPTVIDRSLSFYILEKLQQRGGAIPLDRFEDIFTREYSREHRLVDVRLTEQQASGTVVLRDGCVSLTPRGQRLATFSRKFREYFLPRHRLLMGKYTSVLTDAFRGGETHGVDACHPTP